MATRFRILASLAGWFGLVLQYWLVITGSIGPGPLGRTVNFFSYFTILTNSIAALAMTAPWLAPQSAAAMFFSRPTIRTAITGCMIIVTVVVYFVLRHVTDFEGWDLVADVILHYVTPALFVIDWLVFVPKGTLAPRHVWLWFGYPIAYMVWTILHGALSGFYPYPFVNVAALGYPRALSNMGGLLVAFLLVWLALVVLDRLMGSRTAGTAERPN